MKKLWIIMGAFMLVSFVLAGKAWAFTPHNSKACRDYTKNAYYNGAAQRGYAQACHIGGGKWQITQISGPQMLYSPLVEMVKRDVFQLGGLTVSINSRSYQPAPVVRYYNSPTYYYKQPSPVYYKQWNGIPQQRTVTKYVTVPNKHYKHHDHHRHGGKDKHRHDRHDKRDRHDRHDHDHRDHRR